MIAGILLGIVAGLLANELCELSPWCARKLVRWAAFRRYTDRGRAEMRAEEWTSVINDRPGNLFKLITAAGFTATAVIVSGRRAVGQKSDVGLGSKTVLLVRQFMYAPLVVLMLLMDRLGLAQFEINTRPVLLNGSTWKREAAVELARAVRTGVPAALALVDIDHFRVVDFTYGPLVRDKVLRAVTDLLFSQLRTYDLVGRFGEEGFAVLLPLTREVDALIVAERLRTRIAGMPIPLDDEYESGTCIKLTISVGVATLDSASCELTDMLAAADAALYRDKGTRP